MRLGIAPVGTDPNNKGAWLYVDVENIRIEHETPPTWHSLSGETIRTPLPRTTYLKLVSGKEIRLPPNISYRIERAPAPPRVWAEPDGLRECAYTPADKRARSLAIMNELTYAFPQRFIAGLPSEEDKPLTLEKSFFTGVGHASIELTHPAKDHSVVRTTGSGSYSYPSTASSAVIGAKDHSFLALQLLRNVNVKDITSETLDGRTTIAVGAAKVYRAESEDEAKRNLDFAIANLKSYLYWITDGIKAKAKRDADLKAAEARAKKEQAEREAKVKEARRIDGLALKLYNASLGKYASSPWPFLMGHLQKEKWVELAKQADKINVPQPITASFPDFTKLADDINRAFSTRPFGY